MVLEVSHNQNVLVGRKQTEQKIKKHTNYYFSNLSQHLHCLIVLRLDQIGIL